jgi:hypothetical protein
MARAAAWRALLLGLCSSRDSAWIAPTFASCSLQYEETKHRTGKRVSRTGHSRIGNERQTFKGGGHGGTHHALAWPLLQQQTAHRMPLSRAKWRNAVAMVARSAGCRLVCSTCSSLGMALSLQEGGGKQAGSATGGGG